MAPITIVLAAMEVLVAVAQKPIKPLVAPLKHLGLATLGMEMQVALVAHIHLAAAVAVVALAVRVKRITLDGLVALVEQILFLELLSPMRLVVVVHRQTPLQTHLLVLQTQETERQALVLLAEAKALVLLAALA
jgi:hypothetical protein